MPKKERVDLDDGASDRLVAAFLDNSTLKDGQRALARGAAVTLASSFNLNVNVVRRKFKKMIKNREEMGVYTLKTQYKGNCGRPRVYCRESLTDALEELPMQDRRTQRSVAQKLGISQTTFWRLVNDEKIINPHTNAVKPSLTDPNKHMRAAYAAMRIEKVGVDTDDYVYQLNTNDVHVDEKWFFLTEQQARMYISRREKEQGSVPQRTVKHKSHITKVMFLCAVARPRYNEEGVCTFDGKLGIWPFTKTELAQRNSANRAAGTPVTKPVNCTREVYTDMIINKVLPAIREKWPREDRSHGQTVIYIQQDNAPAHFNPEDLIWQDAATSHPRFLFKLRMQPANSPDTNVLDLGFFRSLQALQWQQGYGRTIDDLIGIVQVCFRQYEQRKLFHIFITHSAVLDEILKDMGGNSFALPHLGKDRAERRGELDEIFPVSAHAIDNWREMTHEDL